MSYLQKENNNLNQWEAVIPATFDIATRIFGGGGESEEQKKAASIARRQGDASSAVNVIQPISDLVNQATWDRIQQAFLTAAQTGQSFGIAASVICQAGYNFATKASELINATPPSMILRKTGGYPSWTDLQQKLSACVSKMKPPITSVKAKTFIKPISKLFKPAPVTSTLPISYTPYQSYLPTQPATQTITIPEPYYDPAPAQAGIDPTWLIAGGVGLFALIMMQK